MHRSKVDKGNGMRVVKSVQVGGTVGRNREVLVVTVRTWHGPQLAPETSIPSSLDLHVYVIAAKGKKGRTMPAPPCRRLSCISL